MLRRRFDTAPRPAALLLDEGYTGQPVEFEVPWTGDFLIRCWGAIGNYGATSSGSQASSPPGAGGYVEGSIRLTKGVKLYVYVGNGAIRHYPDSMNANYNGGGEGNYQDFLHGASSNVEGAGGGATDVRLVHSPTYTDIESLRSRIMVAAGGGGGVAYLYCKSEAGPGGGLSGYMGCNDGNGSPASQTRGGAYTGYTNNGMQGALGLGGRYAYDGTSYSSGGGGGYYGGPSGPIYPNCICTGGGGSSYISGHQGCTEYEGYVFRDTVMIDGRGYLWEEGERKGLEAMPAPDGGYYAEGYGHSGAGRCKIYSV